MVKFTWVPETPQPHHAPIGKILVLGATGNLGFTVCQCLATFKIPFVAAYKAGTRHHDNINELHKLQNNVGSHIMSITEVDWNRPDTIKNALQGIERVFLKVPIGLIDEAALTFVNCLQGNISVRYICYLSFLDARGHVVPADPNNPEILIEQMPAHKLGIAAYWGEQRIKSLKDFSFSIVRPSFLFSNLLFDVPTIKNRGEIRRPLKDSSVNIVSDTDVAQAVCALLTQHEFKHTGGAIYHLTGSALHKFTGVASILSDEIGKPIKYVDVTENEYKGILADCGLDREGLERYVSSHTFMKQGGYDWTFDDINKIIGIKPRPLREMVRDNIELFK